MSQNPVKHSNGFTSNAKAEWDARSVILKPLISFVGIMIAFYAFWSTQFFQENILSKVASGNAYFASIILNVFGMNTSALDDQIMSPKFSVNVKAGCDGLEAIMLCMAGMLVFPAKWSLKLRGIVYGLAFLLFLNLFRIVTLFLTGIYYKQAFDFMHLDFWQVVFILLAIATVLTWIKWVNRKEKTA